MNDSARTRRLLVVDGHSLAFRAYYANPVENFSTAAGQPTNAVYGFVQMLSSVINNEHPTHLAVAFDVAGGTFRNQLLEQYKGTREAAPEELLSQLPLIQRLLEALGVVYVTKQGFEGDDVIATLATMGEDHGFDALVLSGDRDAFQLIDDHITVLYPGHHFKDLKHMDVQAVIDKYKVTPSQYPDLAAMRGETADNIPGVPGVGDGYAAKWINQFGSLESIIEHADELPGKKGQALRDNIDQVKLNRKVNALVRDLDLGVSMDDLRIGAPKPAELGRMLGELEFGSRTRALIARTFPAPADAAETDDGADDADEPLPEAVIDALPDGADGFADAFDDWFDSHAAPTGDAAPGAAGTDAPEPTGAAGTSDAPGAPEDSQGADAVAARLETMPVLLLEGVAKPGRAALERLTVRGPDWHAVSLDASQLHDGAARNAVRAALRKLDGAYMTHGYKESLHLAAAAGLDLPTPAFDTKLGAYLKEPDFHAATFEETAAHFLDEPVAQATREATQGELLLDDDGAADGGDQGPSAADAAVGRAVAIRRLAHLLAPVLDRRGQYPLMRGIELPVSRILHGMEAAGAGVDRERLVSMRDDFGAQAERAQLIAWETAGERINLQSPKQLQKVLFDDMGLKPTKRTKTGFTTNAAALQEMYARSANNERANTFLGALLRFRETIKLKQIVQSLLDAINPADGRIHTTFEQTVAATGRLSSTDPNLQNIPNRDPAGRVIRGAFTASGDYVDLLSADYSQVELRIMAHLSGDEALIEAFRSGADFHRYVASLVYGIPVDQISADQRSHVKAMSYGLAYGLSTYGLAHQLGIAPVEADLLKQQYFATFGKVHDYLESLVEQAKRDGYTETMFGRRRYFPGLRSNRRQVRDAAERAALNAPIQGSAADIMKISMIKADQALRDAGVKSRVILQIHDELVVELAPGEVDEVTGLVRDAMEHAVELAVPLDVSTGVGKDWQLAAH